ncbi:lysophospholipid acyltransferase family protein [Petrachloros mirabilis]
MNAATDQFSAPPERVGGKVAPLYILGKLLIRLLEKLPVTLVARLGRVGGLIAWSLAHRRRGAMINNMLICFGTKQSSGEIRAMVRENFCRLGEVFLCLVKTAPMDKEALEQCLSVIGTEKLVQCTGKDSPPSCLLAIGHFGNFELFGHLGTFLPGWQCVTTYRRLRQEALDRLVLELRSRSGCLYYDRGRESEILKAAAQRRQTIVGLLADQRVGKGIRLPFLGRACLTSRAPALFALRYDMRLFPAVCYRVGLAQWRIEIGDEIPIRQDGKRRTPEDIMLDVNSRFEEAVFRDPVNWFWVHDRWKSHGEPLSRASDQTIGSDAVI